MPKNYSVLDNLNSLTLFTLELIACVDRKHLVKPSNRYGASLMVVRIFNEMWREFPNLYTSICTAEGRTEKQCEVSGPFIVRSALLRLLSRGPADHPVLNLLRYALKQPLVPVAGGGTLSDGNRQQQPPESDADDADAVVTLRKVGTVKDLSDACEKLVEMYENGMW